MLDNGVCNHECNNLECGHDGYNAELNRFTDCTLQEAEEACVPAMRSAGINYRRPPRRLGVSLHVSRLELDVEPSSKMRVSTQLESVMQWESRNLFDSACFLALPGMLTLTRSQLNSRQGASAAEARVRQYSRWLYLPILGLSG